VSDGQRRRLIRYVPNWDEEGTGRTEIIEVSPEEYETLVGTQDALGNRYLAPDADTTRAALQERVERETQRELSGRSPTGTTARSFLDAATFGLSEWAIEGLSDDEQQERELWEAQRARDPMSNLGGALGGALLPWGGPGLLARGATGLFTGAITRGLYGSALQAAGRTRNVAQVSANLGIGAERLASGATAGEVGMIRAPAIIGGRALGSAAGETVGGLGDIAAQSEDADEFWTNLAIVAGTGALGGAVGLSTLRGITRQTSIATRGGGRFLSRAGRAIDDETIDATAAAGRAAPDEITSIRRPITEVADEAAGSADAAMNRIIQDIDRTVEPGIGARISEALGWNSQRRTVLSDELVATETGLAGAQRFNRNSDEAVGRLSRVISDAEDVIRTDVSRVQRNISGLGRSPAARAVPRDIAESVRSASEQLAATIQIPGVEKAARAIAKSAGRGSDAQLSSVLKFRERLVDAIANGTPGQKARATQAIGQIDGLLANAALGKFGEQVTAGINDLARLNRNLSEINRAFGSGNNIAQSLKDIARGGTRADYEKVLADIFSSQGRQRIWGDSLPGDLDSVWQDAMDLEKASIWAKSKQDISSQLNIGQGLQSLAQGRAVLGGLIGGGKGALIGAAAELAPGLARAAVDPFYRVNFLSKYMGTMQGLAKRLDIAGLTIRDVMRGTAKLGGYRGLALMKAGARTEDRRKSAQAAGKNLQYILLGGSREEKETAYAEVLDRLDQMTRDPRIMMQMLEKQNQGLQDFGPEAVMKVSGAQIQQLGALKSMVPPTSDERYLLPGMQKLPPNEAELDKFLEAAAVIDDPVFAVEMLANGVLSNNAARALERGFPQLYQKIAGDIFTEYSNIIQEGGDVNYQYVAQLSTLLGLPLDPSMDAQMIYRLQQSGAQTAEQERTIRSRETMTRQVSNRMASQAETTSQRLNQ
jgi:hypothetical protein